LWHERVILFSAKQFKLAAHHMAGYGHLIKGDSEANARPEGLVTDQAEWEDLGFEVALERLEVMVGDLESGRLGLDQALARYQLGVQLLGHCYRLLEGAERSVALITGLDSDGNPQTARFDATATADRQPPPERVSEVTIVEIDDEDLDDDDTPPF
jgi:exodeoxyribonuclease VII small subunit